MSKADNPLKWLLAQLPTHIDPVVLEPLMQRFEANKVAYARQSRIHQVERMVKLYAGRPGQAEALARWQARLDQLKAREKPE